MKNSRMIVIACMLCLIMSGCGLPYNLTKTQEEQIVEYAADLVLAHVDKYDSRLVDLELYKDNAIIKEENNKMDEVEDTPTIDKEKEPVIDREDTTSGNQDSGSLAELLLPEGFLLDYRGYELVKSYPESDSDNPFFAYDAAEGNLLLVLHFDMQNNSAQSTEIDVFSKAPVINAVINETKRISITPTMLLDDFITFVGTVGQGESIPVVLVAEIKEDMTINTIAISASAEDEHIYNRIQ